MKLAVAVTILVTAAVITLVVLRVFAGWYLGPEREQPAHPAGSTTGATLT